MVEHIRRRLQDQGIWTVVHSTLDAIPTDHDIISLIDLVEPYVYSMTEPDFKALVESLSVPDRSVVWVLPSCQTLCSDPNSAMTIGLARTLRMEIGADITTIEIELANNNDAGSGGAITDIYQSLGNRKFHEDLNPDYEYVVAAGIIKISRLRWTTAKEQLTSYMVDIVAELNVSLEASRRGNSDNIHWIARPSMNLEDGHLKVDVKYMGLSNTVRRKMMLNHDFPRLLTTCRPVLLKGIPCPLRDLVRYLLLAAV